MDFTIATTAMNVASATSFAPLEVDITTVFSVATVIVTEAEDISLEEPVAHASVMEKGRQVLGSIPSLYIEWNACHWCDELHVGQQPCFREESIAHLRSCYTPE